MSQTQWHKEAGALQENTGRLLKQMAAARDNLDCLFAELDVSLTESRHIFNQVAVTEVAGSHASSVTTTRSSNAAMPGWLSSAASDPTAADELQVPAYVHVGEPLVAEESAMATPVCHNDRDICWYATEQSAQVNIGCDEQSETMPAVYILSCLSAVACGHHGLLERRALIVLQK